MLVFQIKEETGADITTRGSYLPDKSMATPTVSPLVALRNLPNCPAEPAPVPAHH